MKDKAIQLLRNLYAFIVKYLSNKEKQEIESKFKLFPDQSGTFRLAKDLHLDGGIEKEYYELCQKYNLFISEKLLAIDLTKNVEGFITI